MNVASKTVFSAAAALIVICGMATSVAAQNVLLMMDDIVAADQQTYRDALTAASVTWDEWDLDTLSFPTAGDLAPYVVLIWADESTLTPGDADCQVVADWLVLGGKRLFATSVDFLWDLENGTPGAGENNLYLLFETTYQGDYAGTGITGLDGVASDPIGNPWSATPMAVVGTTDSNGDYADAATSTATAGLNYGAGGSGSGFAALTHLDNAGQNYKTVWLGINFHNGITNQADRDTLMGNIMTFFQPIPVELMTFTVD
jgi:hypothetical protein